MRFFSRKYILSFLYKLLCKKQIAASYSLSWEQRKVREVTDRYDNLRIPVAASLRVAGTTPYYGANGIQDYVEGYTHDGEFILVAEDGANDLKNYPVKCVKGRIWVNNHAHVLQGKCACADNQFLAYAISQADIESLLVGGGRAKLNAETLMDIELLLPSKDEQIQIGHYLARLDNLITLHQRKWKRINFAVHTDQTITWEQRKFSELYEKVSRKNDLTYGKDDIISVANMYFKEDSYITDESYLLTYNIFELGDIAFEGNKSKNYAHGRFVENTIGNGIVSHVFDVFKPIMKPYDLQFWKYAINNEQLMGGILLRSTKASTMMTNLVANDFLQETFLTPTYPEQQKIGAFFQQLDNLITLHQCEFQIVSKRRKARR